VRLALRIVYVAAWIVWCLSILLACYALAAGLSGSLDEAGHTVRWYQSVGMVGLVLLYGTPAAAAIVAIRTYFHRRRRRECEQRGFEPIIDV
jgi:hypothetical protein